MKWILTLLLLLVCSLQLARAQATTQVFVWRNSTRMMLEASPPIVLQDSANFRIRCLNRLPHLMDNGDSLFFECTLLAEDGQLHSTSIHFPTSVGIESLQIEMLAPDLECTLSDRESHIVELGYPHPNPARDEFSVLVEGSEPGARLEFYSLSEGMIYSVPITGESEYAFSTIGLRKGTYYLRLLAGNVQRGVAMVAVEH